MKANVDLTPPPYLEGELHRTAALCLECALDRFRERGSTEAHDECARACIAGVTSLLAGSYDAVETSAILMRCADACDKVIAEGGHGDHYGECSRSCWHLAGELTGAVVGAAR